jgi:PKD repeat protein
MYYNSSMTGRNSISNNIVDFQCDYYMYGIMAYCYYNNQLTDVSYNTVIARPFNANTSVGNKYLLYLYYVDGLMYNNNVVDLDNGGTNYGIYDYYSTGPYSNNNIFHANLGSTFNSGAKNGSVVADLAAFKTTMGDQKAMSINPLFTNLTAGDYKPSSFNFVNKGTPITQIKIDNANVTRNSTAPDVGALEYYIDVEVANVTLANTTVCGGYKENITVTLKNNNTVDIQNVPIAFTINGVRKVSEVSTIKIAPGKTGDFTFKTPAEFNFPGTSTLDVFLDGTDDNTGNNLITKTLTVTPSPYGGSLAESSSFPGYFRQGGSGGSTSNPDVTIPALKITYDINNPTNNPNSTYGSAWTMTGEFKTSGGMTITSGAVLNGPSGSNNGTIEFTPSTSLMDSFVFIGARVTNTSTKCDSVFGRWVYIPHVPTVDFTFKPACDGEVIEFRNLTTIAKGNLLYDWQFNDPKSNEDATDVSDPVYKYGTYGTYNTDLTIRLAAYPKFEFKKTLQVAVTPVPTIDFKVLNACEGLAINFANTTSLPAGVVGTINYTWNFGGAGSGDPVTTKNPKYTYAKAGGYKVTLTAVSNGCASTITKNANQFAKPKASFTKTGNCNLEEISFTNKSTISIGNTGNTWYFGDGDISNLSDPVHVFQGAGAKSVKLVTTSEFGCKDSATVLFTLAESPKADFKHSDPCNLTETQFNMSGTKPAGVNSIFEWNFNGEGTASTENPKYMFSNVGMKDITLIIRSANGCSDMITKSFPVKLQAKANFIANDVCEGDEVSFTNKSFVAAGDLQYEWRLGDGEKSTKTSPKHAYAATGSSKTFLVTLVANVLNGCSDSVTLPVNVNAKANAAFTAQTSGRTVKFSQTTTDPSNTYNWRFGDGGSAQSINPSHEYYNIDKGTFQACLGIINNAGCLSEKCETVTINLVSVEDISANGLNVYPNPSKGQVFVSFDQAVNNGTVEVYNLLGEVVYNVSAFTGNKVELNLDGLSEGVYIIRLNENGAVSSQRFVLTK